MVPSTFECDARICSSRVDPARGSPTIKNGIGPIATHAPPRGQEFACAHRHLQSRIAFDGFDPESDLAFLQAVAALIVAERFGVVAAVLERLAERETDMVPVHQGRGRRPFHGMHALDFSV
jgi:hypothetical protein